MKRLAALATLLFVFVAASAFAGPENLPAITITHGGSQAPAEGFSRYFTGPSRVVPLHKVQAPSRLSASLVTFQPGARTLWHTHPLGQLLIVTDGTGWIQQWGRPKQVIQKGDIVWIPPGVKHWHGATATTRMTHYAILESFDGKRVEWMEKVTDAQYNTR